MPDGASSNVGQGTSLTDRVVLEVRAVFIDGLGVPTGDQESRCWHYGEPVPKTDPQPWMEEPRKTWAHPQDPIVLSFLVRPENEQTARDWIAALGQKDPSS